MSNTQTRDTRWVFLLLAAYFVVQVCVRLAISHSMDLDESEQVFRSQWLAAGYGPQPPFYNWLQYGVFQLTGVSLVALSVVKNSLLFLAYLFYGLTARLLLRDKALAAIATLGLLTLPQVVFEMQRDLTHTVAVFFAASIFLYGFTRSLKQPSALSYLIAGIGIGIGVLAKYNFALLPAGALIAALIDPRMRRQVFDWRLAFTAGAAILIPLPHLIWLKDNLGFATARTLEKLTDSGGASYFTQITMGISSLFLAGIGFAALAVAVFLAVFRKDFASALSASSEWTRLFERMILFFAAGILLLIVFSGVATVKDRWLVPLLFVVPLYLCLKVEASGIDTSKALRRFMPVAIFILIGIPTALYASIATARFTGHYQRPNIPYASLVTELRKQAEPGAIIAGTSLLAGNLRLDMPDIPIISLDYSDFTPDLAGKQPLLIVWRVQNDDGEGTLPPRAAEWLRRNFGDAALDVTMLDVPYFYARGGDSSRFAYTWLRLPPK